MRVISGKYKHRRFDIPSTFKARPTTDFAKESLFNILAGYFDFDEVSAALDLFSGTGSIGLELVSRGCHKVISVEKDPQHFAFINKIARELNTDNWFPLRADAFRFIEKSSDKFDIIFADPPYQLEGIADIPNKILERNLLTEDGLLILEHGKNLKFDSDPNFVDHRNYGSVNFTFFKSV